MSLPGDLPERLAGILAEEVGSALAMDGSTIELLDVTGGVVQIRLHSACIGCPSTVLAVIMGIEEELRRRIPAIEHVEVVP